MVTKILAAIWYSEDQNAPSCPFVLRLEVPEDTKEAVAQALLVYAIECYSEDADDAEYAEGFAINESPFCGDWCISNCGTHLFASQEEV